MIKENNIYAYINSPNCTEEINDFWHWLLMTSPEISTVEMNSRGDIEFFAKSSSVIRHLSLLSNSDFGYLYHGTLADYYEMLSND